MSCAVGGSGGRGGRRRTKRSSPRSIRKVKFEPPPSPIRVAPNRARAEPALVEERLDVLLDDQRGFVGHRCDATHHASAALPDAACRGLVCRRARPRGRAPDRARARAGGGRAPCARRCRLRSRGHEPAAAHARDGGGRRSRQLARAVAGIRRVAGRAPGRRPAGGARSSCSSAPCRCATRRRGSSAASRSARRSTACCRRSTSSWRGSGRRRSPSSTAA